MGQVLVFRVVQNQVLYPHPGRRFTGVFDGGMVLFIGMKDSASASRQKAS